MKRWGMEPLCMNDFSGIEALGDLIEMQREQSRGINMSWDIQPVYRWNSSQEDSVIFVDEVTLRMKPGGT